MELIKTQTVYLPVDISERPPEERGWYNLSGKCNPEPCGRFWFNGTAFTISREFLNVNLYWLEKKSDMVVMTIEEFKKIAGDAFDAGGKYAQDHNLLSGYPQPAKIEYINQLIK